MKSSFRQKILSAISATLVYAVASFLCAFDICGTFISSAIVLVFQLVYGISCSYLINYIAEKWNIKFHLFITFLYIIMGFICIPFLMLVSNTFILSEAIPYAIIGAANALLFSLSEYIIVNREFME